MPEAKSSAVISVPVFFVTNLPWTLTEGRELVQIIFYPKISICRMWHFFMDYF